MPDLVVVDRLVKRYGPRAAVRGVSFAIEEGEVIGLLGPNGSGKSTILRVLAGYLPPSAGTVRIAGIDMAADSLAARMQVGYVPEDAPLYDSMRVTEFLHFMATIKGVPGRAQRGAVGAAAERLELGPVLGMAIGKLSRGYRQRVAIAQALVNDPPLLILDEPTNALDAYQVIAVRALVRSLAGRRQEPGPKFDRAAAAVKQGGGDQAGVEIIMPWQRRLAVLFVMLALAGCAPVAGGPDQVPNAPYQQNDTRDTSGMH